MATIGLSKPLFAVYSNSGTTVTYANGGVLGKYTELSLDLDEGADNILYADNAPAESDTTFTGGTVTISTDDLLPTVAEKIFGVTTQAISTSVVSTEGSWLINDDSQVTPYLGLGGVVMKKVGGTIYYVGFAFDKVQFRNPNKSITTKGETIEWQVPELTATVFRSDNVNHSWYRETTLFTTEADAEAAVKDFLSIT